MGRIPVFTDTVLPNTAVGAAAIDAARAPFDQKAQNFAQLGRAAGQAQSAFTELQLRQAEANNTTAVNNGVIQYKKDLTDQQNEMRMQRLATPDNFHKDFDKHAEESAQHYAEQMPSEVARTTLQTSMSRVREQMYEENLAWENVRKVDTYAASTDNAAKNLGDLAYQRGAQGKPIEDLLRDADATAVAGSTFTAPEKVADIRVKTRQTIFKGQLLGIMTSDPSKALQILNGQAEAHSGFDQAATFVMKTEGGFVSNDGGRGPTNLGINQEANPGVDVTTLTPEKAKEIYKTNYWDAIGAGDMPPALAAVAFDSAVNQGVPATKQMLAQAGGDPATLLSLREDRYRQTATNPTKAQYLDGWLARLDKLKQFASDQALSPAAGSAKDPSIDTLPFETIMELRSKANTFIKADIELRDKDPATYAQVHNLTPNAPLNFADPVTLKTQLASRENAAQNLTAKYGAPFKPLTEQEAKNMTAALSTMPTDHKLNFLTMFRDSSSTPQGYQAVLQQIRPDSPTTALAGMYLGIDRTLPGATHWFGADDPAVTPTLVAKRLLDGEDLLNPAKAAAGSDGKKATFPIPPDGKDTTSEGMRGTFDEYVGDSFRGMPQAESQAFQAYKAFYAAEAAQRGNYSGVLDLDIARRAVQSVIGGVGEKGGKSYIMPWGMDETGFNDAAKLQFDALKKVFDKKEFNLDRVSWDDVALENTGEPGKYRMVVGAGYLSDAAGIPLTLKMGQ